jgi:hypothetical protein
MWDGTEFLYCVYPQPPPQVDGLGLTFPLEDGFGSLNPYPVNLRLRPNCCITNRHPIWLPRESDNVTEAPLPMRSCPD